jgi:hypothetical protein
MENPFDFDFDKAEKEIKKEKEKFEKEKEEQENKSNLWSNWPQMAVHWQSVRWDWDADFVNLKGDLPIEFGKVRTGKSVDKVRQGCELCKNHTQNKINTCRQCKFHDRRNRQSNFILDKNIEVGYKFNKLWKDVF